MSTAYYFVPSKEYRTQLSNIMYNQCKSLLQVYTSSYNNIQNNIPQQVHTLFSDIEDIYSKQIGQLKDDIYTNYNADSDMEDVTLTMQFKIHICNTSYGWKPLFEANSYYNSLKSLQNFYNQNKQYLDCINEYNEYKDFNKLVTELKKMYKDKNRSSHIDCGMPIFKDEDGYEFTNMSFS